LRYLILLTLHDDNRMSSARASLRAT
jgi:hypothetical protein